MQVTGFFYYGSVQGFAPVSAKNRWGWTGAGGHPTVLRPVQYGGSTIFGPRLIIKKYQVADGMLSPIH